MISTTCASPPSSRKVSRYSPVWRYARSLRSMRIHVLLPSLLVTRRKKVPAHVIVSGSSIPGIESASTTVPNGRTIACQLRRLAAADCAQPLRKSVLLLQCRQRTARHCKCLLGSVFCEMNLSQTAARNPDRHAIVPLIQLGKTCQVSLAGCRHKLSISRMQRQVSSLSFGNHCPSLTY